MAAPLALRPAFGKADLSNCEREQIQLAGSIQSHGAMLVVSEPDHIVVQASANAAAFLNLPQGVLGRPLSELDASLAELKSRSIGARLHEIPLPLRCRIGEPPLALDGLLHRPPAGGLVLELERAVRPVDLSTFVAEALQEVIACPSLRTLCEATATLLKTLTGHDRVMVYRFDEEGHGEIFSEQRRPDLEPFLGNRYPASDIPQIARRLYERNRVRVLADVEAPCIPLLPRLSPVTGQDLDMSLCFLRSMSPIHIQYLKNMGVNATLVVSLMVGGKLWGLVACHHYSPRTVSIEVRAACELLAEAIGTRIAALESFVRAQAESSVRRLEQRMVDAIARDGDWRTALFDSSQALLQPVGASGAALLFDGQVLTTGEVPGTQQLRDIGAWLDGQPHHPIFATHSLPEQAPQFAHLVVAASGLLAAPVSRTSGEYLLWFRQEQVKTVTWGGDPFKPFLVGNDPTQLSPRRSFAQWHQVVEGTSQPWTQSDLSAARLIGESVADVILQFRSVRMLIAQDQLQKVSRDVRLSDQPVMIADERGRILLANEAFETLLHAGHPHLEWLDDLSQFFAEPISVRERFRNIVANGRSWRGEMRLDSAGGGARPVLLRADPIRPEPDKLLGFVLLFTDLTERKTADAARRRFQEGLIERPPVGAAPLDSKASLVYRNLLATVVENAQLAALEVTEGVDTTRMPAMLESLRASVGRTAEVLQRLVRHAADSGPDERPKTAAIRGRSEAKRKQFPGNGRLPPEQLPKR
jgi:PAS domain S-box-containing protein